MDDVGLQLGGEKEFIPAGAGSLGEVARGRFLNSRPTLKKEGYLYRKTCDLAQPPRTKSENAGCISEDWGGQGWATF